jgi:hypothetical protein
MLDYSITCIVWGEEFSPSLAVKKLGIELYDNTEPGEITSRGRWMGKPSPFGFGTIKLKAKGSYQEGLEEILDILKSNLKNLKSLGGNVDYICIDIFYKQQCNLEFNPKELKMIGDMGIPLCISCCESEEPSNNDTK